jgi:hypothetical protein
MRQNVAVQYVAVRVCVGLNDWHKSTKMLEIEIPHNYAIARSMLTALVKTRILEKHRLKRYEVLVSSKCGVKILIT